MSKRLTRYLLICCLAAGLLTEARAQQTPLFGQYFLNPYLANPATVGAGEEARAFLLYRRQWAEITGGPETQAFTLESRLRNTNVGLGIMLYNDVTGIMGKTSGMLSSSVGIDLTETQRLSFGMSLGLLQNRIRFDRIIADDNTDEALLNQLDERTTLNGNLGLAYTFKSLQVGVAVDQLFENTITHENADGFRGLDYRLVRHYFASIRYDYQLHERWVISPLIASRVAQGLQAQTDFNLRFQYNNAVWLNAAYRGDFGFGLSLGFEVENTYSLAYTYELPNNDLSIIGGNAHEISIGIRFHRGQGSRRSNAEPVEQEAIETLQTQINGQYEKIDRLEQANETLSDELEESKRTMDAQARQLEALRQEVAQYEAELEETIRTHSIDPDQEPEMEAGAGYYLVVGAFKTIRNAKRFQALYNRESGQDTRLVQSNTGTWYFIYTEQLQDLKGASQKLQTQRKGPASKLHIGQPWIFKKQQP